MCVWRLAGPEETLHWKLNRWWRSESLREAEDERRILAHTFQNKELLTLHLALRLLKPKLLRAHPHYYQRIHFKAHQIATHSGPTVSGVYKDYVMEASKMIP